MILAHHSPGTREVSCVIMMEGSHSHARLGFLFKVRDTGKLVLHFTYFCMGYVYLVLFGFLIQSMLFVLRTERKFRQLDAQEVNEDGI